MKNKISICIPTYKRLSYLKELVDNILKQTYRNYEICISQDVTPAGPAYEIKDYCESLIGVYPEIIKYKLQAKNVGLAGNWNALSQMAQGDFVFIPGDDDLVDETFLEKMLNTFSDEADVIFCSQIFINSKGEMLHELTKSLNIKYKREEMYTGMLTNPIRTVLQNSIPMSSSLIRRYWFSRFSFDERLNTPELEFFLKIALANGKFYYVNEKLAFYRIHEASATSSGLTTGQFLNNIIDLSVPDEYEKDKVELINNSIISGINNAMKNKNTLLAINLYHSTYNFKRNTKQGILQRILILLPNFVSRFILLKLKP